MSFPLIEKAGVSFKHGIKNSDENITLRLILTAYYRSTIHECNDLLAEAGYPPLSADE